MGTSRLGIGEHTSVPYTTVHICYNTPQGRFSTVGIFTVGILSAPKRWALEVFRRELSEGILYEYMSFGIGTTTAVVLTPVSSNRPWKTARGGCDSVLHTPSYAVVDGTRHQTPDPKH